MPASGLPPFHSRSSSMMDPHPVPPNTRNRAATTDSPLNPVAPEESASTVDAIAPAELLTKADLDLLVESFEKWVVEDGRPIISRERDVTEFLRSILDGDVHVEDGQIFMTISEMEALPNLPSSLAEKMEGGILLEKAKVKFVDPPLPFGYNQFRQSTAYEPDEPGRERNTSEQKFPMGADMARRGASPLPGAESKNELSIQVSTPEGLNRSLLQGTATQPNSPVAVSSRSSSSISPRSSASDPSPRNSERFSNWGRNLFGMARPASPQDAPSHQVLETTPRLSDHILANSKTKAQMAQLQTAIHELAKTKLKAVLPSAFETLGAIRELTSRPHKLDCLKELTLHVLNASLKSSSPLAGEKKFFAELDRQLVGMQLDEHDTYEYNLHAALLHFAVARGRLAED